MTLPPKGARPALDRGEADPYLRAVLASAYSGGDAYPRAVAALCSARLILPTIPAPPGAEPGASSADDDDHHDGTGRPDHPDMAAVLLRSSNGDKGVVVFTGYDALHAWRSDAHPVRCTLDDVAATVGETGSTAIIVDVAGPFSLVIEGALVDELAIGHRLIELPDGGFGWLWVDPAS